MMSKTYFSIVLAALFTLAFASCSETGGDSASKSTGDNFSISGTIADATGRIYLLAEVIDGSPVYLDSVESTDGSFSFSGNIEEPQMYYLVQQELPQPVSVFTEPGAITVDANLATPWEAKVTGSATHDTYAAFISDVDAFGKEIEALRPAFQQAASAGDTATANAISRQAEAINTERIEWVEEYIAKNNKDLVTAYIAVRHFMMGVDEPTLLGLHASLEEGQPDNRYVQKMGDYIKKKQSLKVGSIAPDFTMENQVGEKVSLSDFRGKFLLIDFWASWCGPCRRANPHVVALYNQYKDKDFEILGVSLDDNKENWLQAIAMDQLTWTHVSDLKKWGSAAADLYEVRSIPATVLLDKEGRIIEKNLSSEQLAQRLAEILL